ncbi:MAG: D-tyrosyl-tRNA(Tyr) deacylase [Planctomycetes bacterium ADurb.Bin126]|nr:MAG: D-tyrosyl-tRNA(Tyr) deacylase [Planctomycetes bacterium ADurb.Bin126]HOD83712.1 D-aminoacyl-tRNA deacylase [Phycisphaerae bacterium]HQL75894.1 D-aminoacyl-tRNA deacylase [Phycisphaerae bacterium]
MRAVIQRVLRAKVCVNGQTAGSIQRGLLVYLGVGPLDSQADAAKLADKIAFLRIFEDDNGKMNRSVQDVRGGVLAVPNFTLYADARKGRRPAFTGAAGPQEAVRLFEAFVAALKVAGCTVASGIFGAHMEISSLADGPVNILYDTQETPSPAPAAPARRPT